MDLSTLLSAVIVNADITCKRLTKKYVPKTYDNKIMMYGMKRNVSQHVLV